jgi:hypothetical protein
VSDKTFAEVAEGVRATIAVYAQALDDGRTDDVVATFCRDGVCDIPRLGRHEGHDALRQAYDKLQPRGPQRHLVVNTLLTEWSDQEATADSDFVLVRQTDAGWVTHTVGRYHDVLSCVDGVWRFRQRLGELVG